MIVGKNVVAVRAGGSKQKIGFVRQRDDGGYNVTLAADASTAITSKTDSVSAVKPAGAEAVIHGHIDGHPDGVISPADAAPLAAGLPKEAVSEGRVGVAEILGGRLQFQMLDGKMTQRESRELQKSLDNQQRQPEFMKPAATSE